MAGQTLQAGGGTRSLSLLACGAGAVAHDPEALAEPLAVTLPGHCCVHLSSGHLEA